MSGPEDRIGTEIEVVPTKDDIVRCPKCGSAQINFVTHQQGASYSAADGCCGFMACGPIGLLCGSRAAQKPKTFRKCMKCGHEF